MRILIIEDEEHLASGLKFNFEQDGYEVAVAPDGPTGLQLFRQADPPFDLVVLDLMLPGMSGYDTCEELRASDRDVPILVLSARTLAEDKARAFDCGTDQYVTKPFNLPELLSRVRNLIQRRGQRERQTPPSDERVYRFGSARVDFRTFEVTVDGEPRKLTQREIELLRLFIRNEGHVLTRREILEKVWGFRFIPTTRTVDNFVMRLRKHFEQDPTAPRHFLSVRGAGYRFVATQRDVSDGGNNT
jgi:two-component system OmpR family response regulator